MAMIAFTDCQLHDDIIEVFTNAVLDIKPDNHWKSVTEKKKTFTVKLESLFDIILQWKKEVSHETYLHIVIRKSHHIIFVCSAKKSDEKQRFVTLLAR